MLACQRLSTADVIGNRASGSVKIVSLRSIEFVGYGLAK